MKFFVCKMFLNKPALQYYSVFLQLFSTVVNAAAI